MPRFTEMGYTHMSRPCRPRLLFALALSLALGACRVDPVDPPPVLPATGGAPAGTGGVSTGTGGAPLGSGGSPAPLDAGSEPEPTVKQPLGQPCDGNPACASGFCSDGVCCNTACDKTCSSCALPGLVGTCVNAPAGEDPRTDCPVEPPSTCGRAGGCDGMGRCLMYVLGTECAPLTCRDGIETAAGHCAGVGMCTAGEGRVCGSNMCSNGRCLQGCSAAAPCPVGLDCVNARCVGAGPALHWRFDEATGGIAADSSGNAFGGLYVGEGKTPEPSTSLPPTTFSNPRSRLFPATGRPAVHLPGVSGVLKPANEITVSIWYRASSAGLGGSDIVSMGSDYFIRLKPTDIEFVKRVSNVSGMVYAVSRAMLLTHLDGKWHHVAGVATASGMRLYLDGVLRNSNARGEPIVYGGNDLWVGRDGGGAVGRDFAGELDDLRIYTRALATEDIAALAAGN
jgi:hypothetical protein